MCRGTRAIMSATTWCTSGRCWRTSSSGLGGKGRPARSTCGGSVEEGGEEEPAAQSWGGGGRGRMGGKRRGGGREGQPAGRAARTRTCGRMGRGGRPVGREGERKKAPGNRKA